MIKWIKNFLGQPQQPLNTPFVWCLVGNIVDDRLHGEEKDALRGTKLFPPGSKVYCFPPLWGDGYKSIKVIGKPRRAGRLITGVIASKYVSNWRLQAVYEPHVISVMAKNKGWNNTQKDKETILTLLTSIDKNKAGMQP